MSDYISRQAAVSEIMDDLKDRSLHDDPAIPEDYAEGYDEGIRNAAVIVQQLPSVQLTPCDLCRFSPPSSGDGKPCSMCPASAKEDSDG